MPQTTRAAWRDVGVDTVARGDSCLACLAFVIRGLAKGQLPLCPRESTATRTTSPESPAGVRYIKKICQKNLSVL